MLSEKKANSELGIRILAQDSKTESQWISALNGCLSTFSESIRFISSHTDHGNEGELILVDRKTPNLTDVLKSLDRNGKSVFLIVDEYDKSWDWDHESASHIDDVLVYPFRRIEVESKIRFHHHLRMWNEVHELNHSFTQTLQSMDDDVRLAERLQKAKVPTRFPPVKNLQVKSRYLAGMKSGGDHFDLAESKDGTRLSILLSDSSSYGLSSAFLSALMRTTVRLSQNELRSSVETVKLIHEELSLTLKEKDSLSLFYGILSRKDFKLRYAHLGDSGFFVARKGKSFQQIDAHSPAIHAKGFDPTRLKEGVWVVEPEDRIVILSDGYGEACGGWSDTIRLLDRFRDRELTDLLNELTFEVKRKLKEEDGETEMPSQDCTALVFDVDSKILRLT